METKGSKDKVERIYRRLGFANRLIVGASGIAGGLALLWHDDANLIVDWYDDRIICYNISDACGNICWRLYAVYGLPIIVTSVSFGILSKITSCKRLSPGVLLVTLMKLPMPQRRLEGKVFGGKELFLKNLIDEVAAVDLGYAGRRFTWENRQAHASLIKERLDRAFACSSWISIFP